MKLNELSEGYSYYDREVTDENFDDMKKDMIKKIEAALGKDGNDKVKADILAAPNPQRLASIMTKHIKERNKRK